MARGHRTHGLHVPSATAGPASYAAPSALAETEGSIRCLGSWTPANQGELGTGRDSPGPLEMLSVDETGHALGNGLQKEGGLDRCFQHGLGSSVKTCDQRRKEVSTSNSSSVSNPSCLFTRPEGAPRYGPLGQHDSNGLHNESPRRARFEALFTLVECLLEWAQHYLRSLRATYVPGKLNQGADMLSWSNVSSEEWTLHPQVVQEIWEIFGKAEVDLFASKDNSHCLTYYLKDKDALDDDWPSHLLYAFPPIALIPQVIRRIREHKHKVILALEEPALVLRAVSAAYRSPLAYSPETGPPLSGEQNDLESPARAVGSAPLATQWELAPRVPRQFRSPSGRWPGPGVTSMSSACGLEGFYFLSPGPFSAHGKLDAVIPPP